MKRALGYLHSLYQRVQSTRIRWTFVVPAVAVVLVVFAFGLLPEQVHAIEWIDQGVNMVVSLLGRLFFFFSRIMVDLTVWALKLFIVLAGYNGFSTAPIVELGWTLVRDIANMMFIVAMLVIAFATILGREDYALKKTLGKLILMAILINFSKLIAQLIIDAAHVVTMTFLNALSAVAGGNLIQMFKFNEMRQIIVANTGEADTLGNIGFELLGASILTLIMTSVALATLGVYFIIMLYRMVTLWVLIIFSPIAYAAAALPATASVSKDWWSRFTKNVVSAPMMVFFMWLAFATIGNGSVLSQVTSRDANSLPNTEITQFQGSEEFSASVSKATTWENMAGFAVAIAFLFAGIERVQALGVEGADKLSGAKNLGTKFALGATGVLAGAWVAKKGAKAVVEKAPLVGTDAWKRRGQNISNTMKIGAARRSEQWDTFISDRFGNEGPMGAIGNRIKSRRFKEKVASDWAKAAESAEQIYDTAISTGKTNAGKKKLNLGRKADMSRRRDEPAGERKREQEEAKILAEEAPIAAEIQKRFDSDKEKIEANGALTAAQKEKAIKELSDKKDKEMMQKARYTHYSTEAVNKGLDARDFKVSSKQRVLDAGGLDPRVAIQYEQELYEDREKEFVNLRPSEFEGKAAVYAEQLKDASLDPETKKIIQEKARALLIAAQKKGSFETGKVLEGFESALSDTDKLAVGNTSTRKGMQKFLTKSLGYDTFEDLHNDMKPAEMRQFQTSAEHTAMDGDTRTVGIFNKVYDKKSQREVLEVNTEDKNHIKETVGRATYTSPSKLTGSDGLVSIEFIQDKESGKVEKVASIKTDEDIKRMVAAYSSVQSNTQLHQDNIASLRAIRDQGEKWNEFMEELGKVSEKAATALNDKISSK